jgi:cell division protein FtsQ
MRRLTSVCRPCPPPKVPVRRRAANPPPRAKLRRARPRLDRRLLLSAAAGIAGLAVVSGIAWLWGSGWVARQAATVTTEAYRISAESGLAIEEVFVEGRQRAARSDLLAALDLTRGDPILAFDPRAAQQRVEALAWVQRATVERRLPDTVVLRLEERRPMAIWQLGGALHVIDETGETILGAEPRDFADLTLVVGADAPQYSATLLGLLDDEPELMRRISAAVRVGSRRWNLRFEGGIEVRLPEEDAAAAWAELVRLQREHRVLERDVTTIDLRLPDRLVVRTDPDALRAPAPVEGENT